MANLGPIFHSVNPIIDIMGKVQHDDWSHPANNEWRSHHQDHLDGLWLQWLASQLMQEAAYFPAEFAELPDIDAFKDVLGDVRAIMDTYNALPAERKNHNARFTTDFEAEHGYLGSPWRFNFYTPEQGVLLSVAIHSQSSEGEWSLTDRQNLRTFIGQLDEAGLVPAEQSLEWLQFVFDDGV